MKRFISFIAAAALLCQAAIVFAQDSEEPSIKSVLDAARAKFWQDKGNESEDPADSEAEREAAYTPFLISLVPGITVPIGYYDASFVAGPIGNITRDVSGAEGAGVFNITRDIRGVQGAGVFNIARNVLGFQAAGVFNLVDGTVTGFQHAGVFNMAEGRVTGVQMAGVFNMAREVYAPFQGAGVFNIVDDIYGFQGAGLFNIAGHVVGGQAASVFNQADRVSGIQIGLVNVADHIDGVQLGLINIAGNGVNSIGATYEPIVDFVYAHWQAGTPSLYTVFGLGAPSGDWGRDYTGFFASVGLGSRTRMFGLNVDLDVSAEQAVGSLPYGSFDWEGDWRDWEGWKMIKPFPSVRLMAGLPFGWHFQVVGGIKADINVDALGDRVPEALKKGDSWKGELFGEGFTAWYKWFLGVKI